MEGNRRGTPTVVPLTRNLVEQLLKQQQLQRTTPLQVGQTAAVRPQQSGGATAVNREGQGSRTAVSV